jgi:hypothetical protein
MKERTKFKKPALEKARFGQTTVRNYFQFSISILDNIEYS